MRLLARVGIILAVLAAACGSDDDESDCPAGQVKRTVCLACGPAGGCAEQADRCATSCSDGTDCPGQLSCSDGVCQAVGCI